MYALFDLDWHKVFVPTTSLFEVFVRGTITYLVLFLLLRVVLKRQAGSMEITDVLVVVLIADAAQEGMAHGHTSVTEGVLLVSVILVWDFALDWLGYRVGLIGRLVHPPPLPLVKDGRLLRRNMRKEFITEDELMTQVRKKGLERLEDVKLACVEGDGHISVIPLAGKGT
jgi:uncharacterized membrane protein YcaP (DUF421 family)